MPAGKGKQPVVVFFILHLAMVPIAAATASCSNCTKCQANEYETQSCTPTSDTICATCSSCEWNQFLVSNCTNIRDTICKTCRNCPDGTFQSRPCGHFNNTQCKICTSCGAERFRKEGSCLGSVDSICQTCSLPCSKGTFEIQSCTSTTDRICSPCSACPIGRTRIGGCKNGMDTKCKPCKICQEHEFTAATCNVTHDTICLPCSRCPAGNFELASCTPFADTICSHCSACDEADRILFPCTKTSDSICAPGKQPYDWQVSINLGSSDLDILKKMSSEYKYQALSVYVGTNLVTDVAGNSIRPADVTISRQPDTIQPKVLSFSLDLNERLLNVTVSEAVVVINASAVVIHTQDRNISLTVESSAISNQIISHVIPKNAFDRLIILGFGSSEKTTLISFSSGYVEDFFGNQNDAVYHLRPLIFVPDYKGPTLVKSTLDVNNMSIILDFSEPLRPASLNESRLVLIVGDMRLSFSGSYHIVNHSKVYLWPSVELSDFLKSNLSWGFAFESQFARDRDGNWLSKSKTLSFTDTIIDVTGPLALNGTLNMLNSTIKLLLNEPGTIKNVSALMLFDSIAFVQLSDQDTHSNTYGREIELFLGQQTMNEIKIKKMCITDCYFNFSKGFSEDLFSNPSSRQSNLFVFVNKDNRPPALIRVTLEHSPQLLTLYFSEPVQWVNMSQISIISISSQLQLSFSANEVSSDYQIYKFTLHDTFLDDLKLQGVFSEKFNQTTLLQTSASDKYDNQITYDPLPIQVFFDQDPPSIQSFTLDMNNSLITLSFSEPVDTAMVEAERLQLSNNAALNVIVEITGKVVPLQRRTLSVHLETLAIDRLTEVPKLATSRNDSWLILLPQAIQDVSGNVMNETKVIQASKYIPDRVRPYLVAFTLSMLSDRPPIEFTLTFSESMNLSTLDLSRLTLKSAKHVTLGDEVLNLTVPQYYRPPTGFSRTFSFNMSENDFQQLASAEFTTLCRDASHTWLESSVGFGADASGNINEPSIVIVSSLKVDLLRPHVQAHTLDLEKAQLTLFFDDDILGNSFNATTLAIQNLFGESVSLSDVSVQLASGNALTLSIPIETLNRVKSNPRLGTRVDNTLLVLAANAILDTSLNPNLPTSGLPALGISPDISGPVVETVFLDLEKGYMVLHFDESVQTSATKPSKISLSSSNTSSDFLELSGGIVLGRNGVRINITLTQTDLLQIRADLTLARDRESTFVSFDAGFVTDMSNNTNDVVSFHQIDMLISETTPATAVSFKLNLTSQILQVQYSKPVAVSSMNISSFVLGSVGRNSSYRLSGLNAKLRASLNSDIVFVTLGFEDMEVVRQLKLCQQASDCTLSFLTASGLDFNGLSLPAGDVLTAFEIIPDMISPELDFRGFKSFDLNTGILSLRFTESIDPKSFNPKKLVLQSLFEDPISSHHIFQAKVLTDKSSRDIMIQISKQDLNAVAADDNLCLSRSSCYIHLEHGVVRDQSNNTFLSTVIVDPFSIVQVLVADTTPPEAISFTLDFNARILAIRFSETVDPSLRIQKIHFQKQSNISGMPEELNSYVLTGGDTASQSSEEVVITLLASDLENLKLRSIAISSDTTFLRLESGAVRDKALISNPNREISLDSALQVSNFSGDTVRPRIVEFVLDLDFTTLKINFNEPIRLDSVTFFNGSDYGIKIQNTSLGTGSYRNIHSGLVQSSYTNISKTLIIALTREDGAAIKADRTLATDAQTTFLSIASWVMVDVFDNEVVPILENDALPALIFRPDRTRAELVQFEIDLMANQLLLEFTDAIAADSFIASGIQLRPSLGGQYISLSSTSVMSSNGYRMILNISFEDRLALARTRKIGWYSNSTLLTLSATSFDDTTGNDVIAVTKPIQPTRLTRDFRSPLVTSVHFDLAQGLIEFVFDEPMDSLTVKPESFAIYGYYDEYILTISSAATILFSDDETTCRILLTDNNYNQLLLQNISSHLSTRLVLDSAQDYFGNTLRFANHTEYKVTADTTPPAVLEASLDLNHSKLLLSFSEFVNPRSLNTSRIFFLSIDGNNRLDIFAHEIMPTSLSQIVMLRLQPATKEDILTVDGFRNDLAHIRVVMQGGAIQDIQRNSMTNMTIGITSFTADTVAPILLAYDLNLNSRQMILTFNEAIAINQGYNVTKLKLGHVRLAEDTIVFTNTNLSLVYLNLTDETVNSIKMCGALGRTVNDTVLDSEGGAFVDLSGNGAQEVGGIFPGILQQDTILPALTTFFLDMNDGLLTLAFDDIMNVTSLNITMIKLWSSSSKGYGFSLDLTTTIHTTALLAPEISLTLASSDLNLLKMEPFDIVGGIVWLELRKGSIKDSFYNPINTELVPADFIVQDTRGPFVLRFSLNLTSEILMIFMSEPVFANKTVISLLQLDRSVTANPHPIRLFDSQIVAPPLGQSVVIKLGRTDLLKIQSDPNVATNENNTYLVCEPGAFLDTSYNPSNASQVKVQYFAPDRVSPVLLAFDFKLSTGELSFTFSEAINVSSAVLSDAFLVGNNSLNALPIALDGNVTDDVQSSFNLTIVLDEKILNGLKANPGIATSKNTTFIRFRRGFVTDMAGNPLVEVSSLQVSNFITDTDPPSLRFAILNMTSGSLVLVFSEAVNALTLNLSCVMLAADATGYQQMKFDSTVSITAVSHGTISILISQKDLNSLKSASLLAKSQRTTWISLQEAAIMDESGLRSRPSPYVMIREFVSDTFPPVLQSYALDVDNAKMTLTFNEPVVISSLKTAQMILSSHSSFLEDILVLNDAEALNDANVSLTVALNLSRVVNLLKSSPLLAVNRSYVYLTMATDCLRDVYGNGLISSLFEPPQNFTQDATSPRVLYFDIDISKGDLTIYFDEPVSSDSLKAEKISFIGKVSNVTLRTSGVETPSLATNVTIKLSTSDLNMIKKDSSIATSRNNTFIIIDSGAITDRANNPSMRTRHPPVRIFIADDQPALLLSASLNMSSGIVVLAFSEAVNHSTVLPWLLTLQNNASNPNYSLTAPNGIVLSRSGGFVEILLEGTILNELKAVSQFATLPNNTYISLASGFVHDLNHIASAEIAPSAALQVASVYSDRVPPRVSQVVLNMNSSTLFVLFSETVFAANVDVRKIYLQNPSNTVSRDLGGSVVENVELHSVIVHLSREDLNVLKASGGVLTSTTNTVVKFEVASVVDTNDNALAHIVYSVDLIQPDVTSPKLESFNFSLHAGGTIELFFDEPIHAVDLLYSVFLQDARESPTINLTFATFFSVQFSNYNQKITLVLPDGAANLIKSSDLCTEVADCYIRLLPQSFADYVNNSLSVSNVQQATTFTADLDAIVLLDFVSMDLSKGELLISFNEPVDPMSVNFTKIRLESSFDAAIDQTMLRLQPGQGPSQRVTLATLILHPNDLHTIKLSGNTLCSASSNCYLRIDEGFVTDTAGNPIEGTAASIVDRSMQLTRDRPSLLNRDQTGPILVSFAIDMSIGILNLTFDEPILRTSLNIQQKVEIHSKVGGGDLLTLQGFQSAVSIGLYQLQISVSLLENDVNRIKSISGLAKSPNSTFIRVLSGLITDVASVANANQHSNIMPVSAFIVDTVPPVILEFEYADLNVGTLRLRFDEPVQNSTFAAASLTLISESASYSLVDTVRVMYADDLKVSITIVLSKVDLEAVKRIPTLAVSASTTLLELRAGSIEDMAGNLLISTNIQPGTPLRPTNFASIARAALEAFTLDLTEGLLLMTFSQVIRSSLTIPDAVIIQSNKDGSDPQRRLTLSVDTVVSDSLSYTIKLQLATPDMNLLKAIPDFATASNNTYISFTSEAFTDIRDLPVLSVVRSAGVPVTKLIPDRKSPELVSYQFSLNDGVVELTFDEVVADSVNYSVPLFFSGTSNFFNSSTSPTKIQLQVEKAIILQTVTALFNAGLVVRVDIATDTMNILKSTPGTATMVNDTFLYIGQGFIEDVAGNDNHGVMGVRPDNFIFDTTPPLVTKFILDLDAQLLVLEFDEAVNMTSIVISDMFVSFEQQSVQLLTSIPINSSLTKVYIKLSITDANAIKASSTVGVSIETTFLTTRFGWIKDFSDQPGAAILSQAADVYNPDMTPPQLLSFSLDLNLGVVILTFDEIVQTSSFKITQMLLASTASSANTTMNLYPGATTLSINQTNSTTVVVQLGDAVLDTIKLDGTLGTMGYTYLLVLPSLVSDIAGNWLTSNTTLHASNIVEDRTNPSIKQFGLDMRSGILRLSFDEPVQTSTLNISKFSLQAGEPFHIRVGLHSGTILSSDGRLVDFKMSAQDLDAVKANPPLGLSRVHTLLHTEDAAVMDMGNNSATRLLGLVPSYLYLDNLQPRLAEFRLDMELHQLTLIFNETVNVSSIVPQNIVLQRLFDTSSHLARHQLSGGNLLTTVISSLEIVLELFKMDLDQMKLKGIGISNFTTWLTTNGTVVSDMAGLGAIDLVSGLNAIRASIVIQDTTNPRVVGFSIDLDGGFLYLNFSEPVDVMTVNVTKLGIQSVPSREAATYVETINIDGGPPASRTVHNYTSYQLLSSQCITTEASMELVILLSVEDLDNIKLDRKLAVGRKTSYLYADAQVVADMFGNKLMTINKNDAIEASTYLADTTSPSILYSTFNFDVIPAVLTLLLDEPVAVASINVGAIEIGSSDGIRLSTAQLKTFQDSKNITLLLPIELCNVIKMVPGLASSENMSIIVTHPHFLTDMSSNPMTFQTSTPSLFIPDRTGPVVQEIIVDMNAGNITFIFDEPVLTSSIDPTSIIITDGISNSSVRLSNFSLADSTQDRQQAHVIRLSDHDLVQIKSTELIALQRNTTKVFILPSFASDVYSNFNLRVPSNAPVAVSMFEPDSTAPQVSFTINMSAGSIILQFDEPVRNSFNFSQISLLVHDELHAIFGYATFISKQTLLIHIEKDLFLLLQDSKITIDSVALVGEQGAFTDRQGNNILPTIVNVAAVIPDLVGPSPLAATFDLHPGVLNITFSEAMSSDISLSDVRLKIPGFQPLLLSDTIAETKLDQVSLQLSASALDTVKIHFLLSNSSTFLLELLPGSLSDSSNNRIAYHLLEVHVLPDKQGPRLLNFTFDLDSGIVSLTFDEIVDVETLNMEVFELASSRNASSFISLDDRL